MFMKNQFRTATFSYPSVKGTIAPESVTANQAPSHALAITRHAGLILE
jgi:hypothetical protein